MLFGRGLDFIVTVASRYNPFSFQCRRVDTATIAPSSLPETSMSITVTIRKASSALLYSAFALTLCGCGQSSSPATDTEATVVEEISVSGFDPDGEPVIKKWSDGSIWIHFEAMPPFFSEDDGTESNFDNFDTTTQDAIGATVVREDREVFVIDTPNANTAAMAKAWLESYHDQNAENE